MLNPVAWLRVCLAGGLLCACALGEESLKANTIPSSSELASIVEQMHKAQAQLSPTASYQVVREYLLFGSQSSSASSDVLAEVDYFPPDRKSYVIRKRLGSSRGEEVVRRILEHETEMGTGGKSSSTSAIDGNNYSFTYLGEANLGGNPCYVLGLDPKRKDTDLIRGKVWVDKRSFLTRHVEGQLAKNPSWLLKKVDVKIDFADVDGAWLQTGMEAVADVRFLGSQTLKSQTVEARVGDTVAKKKSPRTGNANRRLSRSGMPATVIVPLDRP